MLDSRAHTLLPFRKKQIGHTQLFIKFKSLQTKANKGEETYTLKSKMMGLTRRQPDFAEIMNTACGMFLSPACKGSFSFTRLLSFIHSARLNNRFVTYRRNNKAPSSLPIQARHSVQSQSQKLSSEVFPNSHRPTGSFYASTFNQQVPGVCRPHGQPSSQQVATK